MLLSQKSVGLRGVNSGIATTLGIGLITLGAASVRFFHLGAKSFLPDEAFSITLARTEWSAFHGLLVGGEANMSLYYLLLRVWSEIRDTPSFVRAMSVVAGVATVPAIYFVGKTIFSRRAGMISALLLAVNVFHISYSQEARSYSLVVLLVTCSSLFFVRCVQTRSSADGAWYILTSTAALYAHFFAALVLFAQFATWTLLPGRLRTCSQLRNLIAIAALGSPLALFIALHGTSHLDWIQQSPHMAKEVYHFFTYLSGSGVKFVIFLLASALASRAWWLQRTRDSEPGEGWPFVFVALWLLLPILMTLLMSLWKPMFVFRFLIVCLPAALLLFGEGLALIRPNWLCWGTLAVMVCSSLIAVRSFYRQPATSDWRAAITYLAENARSGDVLIFASPYCRFPFDYNLRMSGKALPQMRVQYADAGGIRDFPAQAQHVWLVDFYAQAHHHWATLPSENGEPTGMPRFRFQRTLRFPGVEIEEFDSINEIHGAASNFPVGGTGSG